MAIIDAHTHYYPESVFKAPRTWALERNEHHWADCVAPLEGKSIQGWAELDRMLRDMDAAGIEKAVLLGWYWENPQTCLEQNSWYEQAIQQHPDRLLAFASLNAMDPKLAHEIIHSAKDKGFCGIGEVHPQVQGHTLKDPCWQKVMELAHDEDLPINLHVTEPVGRDYPTKVNTPLEDYLWLAEQYPEAKLIYAHWGGLLPFYELNPAVGDKLKNVYYDTAASPLLYDITIFKRVLDTIGSGKILFGSDYPLRLYPGRKKEADFGTFVSEIDNLELDPADKLAIFTKNSSTLLES